MPGTNYIGSAYQTLSNLLNTSIPGGASAGLDSLSGGYNTGVDSGIADLSRRGLTGSGAVPELYTSAGEQFAQGAGQATAQNQLALNKQRQAILDQILGLTSPTLQQASLQNAQQAQLFSNIGQTAAGLFGTQPRTIFGPAQSGFLSSGLFNNPGSFLNQVLGIP